MALHKGKIAAVVMAAFAVGLAATLMGFITLVSKSSVEDLIGQPLVEVRERLGPAAREWPAGQFDCDEKFACVRANEQGGPVLMYTNGEQATYLYFDAESKLAKVEPVRPKPVGPPRPAVGAGAPR